MLSLQTDCVVLYQSQQSKTGRSYGHPLPYHRRRSIDSHGHRRGVHSRRMERKAKRNIQPKIESPAADIQGEDRAGLRRDSST